MEKVEKSAQLKVKSSWVKSKVKSGRVKGQAECQIGLAWIKDRVELSKAKCKDDPGRARFRGRVRLKVDLNQKSRCVVPI